ncbi:hypothetical protein U1Q18_033050 [Sarracenia purpurea var. burkii]
MVMSGFLDGTDIGVGFFIENMDFFDFPMESLEGDGLDAGDWDASLQLLGPIPSETLLGSSLASGGNNGNAASSVVPNLSVPSKDSSELKPVSNFLEEASKACKPLQIDYSDGLESAVVLQAPPSAVSVIESSSSSSSVRKNFSASSEILVPSRTRAKRSRSSAINPWLLTLPSISSTSKRPPDQSNDFSKPNFPNMMPKENREGRRKQRRKKKLSQLSRGVDMEGNSNSLKRPEHTMKRCFHCEVTKTPQWREGPMGPKTLCNACGVRYRSGRLFPEYRPAASPSFVPSMHSNSHKKVVEMRNNAIRELTVAEEDEDDVAETEQPPMPPPPEFVPMSSFLFDCI